MAITIKKVVQGKTYRKIPKQDTGNAEFTLEYREIQISGARPVIIISRSLTPPIQFSLYISLKHLDYSLSDECNCWVET